ncbi:DUF1295-domain-containing protein [Auriculariales sp. MPI-PUGE-AT-0066]|nr:DUF1295-domain-containing protein [Auriculariales sp. MPI-PUGE-AT-0066]
MVVFSQLLPTIATTYGLQAAAASIFIPLQDDKYYDLLGTLGFVSSTAASLYGPALKAVIWDGQPLSSLPALRAFSSRQLLLTAGLGLWTLRLGTFLFARAMRHGGDSRFDEIKKQPARFSFYWFMQANWIMMVGLPIYLINVLPSSRHLPMTKLDMAGLVVAGTSIVLETIADTQKSSWRARKDAGKHDEKFISHGLWAWSRHPNYVAEIGVWTGVFIASLNTIRRAYGTSGVVASALSPLITYSLVRYLSGVPPLERAAKKRFGDDPAWKAYQARTSVFWPWWKA